MRGGHPSSAGKQMQKVHRAWLVLVCLGPKPEVTHGLVRQPLRSTDLDGKRRLQGLSPLQASTSALECVGFTGITWVLKVSRHVEPDPPRLVAAAPSWVFCPFFRETHSCVPSRAKRTQNKYRIGPQQAQVAADGGPSYPWDGPGRWHPTAGRARRGRARAIRVMSLSSGPQSGGQRLQEVLG